MIREDFLKDVNDKIRNANLEKNSEILERIIHIIPEDLFDVTTCIVNDVLNLSDTNQKEIDKIIKEYKEKFLSIESLDLTFKSYSYGTGYYSYYEEVYDYNYFDDDNIADFLKQVYNYGVYLINCKHYKNALEVFDLIIYTKYFCEEVGDPDYDDSGEVYDTYEIDLEDVSKLLDFSLNKLYLYAVYASYFQNNKYELIYNYLCLSDKISFEDAINIGIEKLNNLDKFYKEWINHLTSAPGKRAEALLRDAMFHTNVNEYEVYKKSFKAHPVLYRDYIIRLMISKDYNQIIETCSEALTDIDDNKIKEEICYIVIDAIKDGNLNIDKTKYYYKIFDYSKTIPNFLVLLCNKVEHKDLKNYIDSLTYKDVDKFYFNFFLGNFEEVYNNFISNKNIIELLLLYLSDTKSYSKIKGSLIGNLLSNCNEHHLRNLNIDRRLEDGLLWFNKWKEQNIMPDELKLKYIEKLETIINENISDTLENKIRNQYYIAAKLTVALNEVLFVNNLSSENEYLNKIEKKYVRFLAFRKEIKKYMEK